MKSALTSLSVAALVLGWNGQASALSGVAAPGSLSLGIGIGARSFDRVSNIGLGVSPPSRDGEVSSALELGYQLWPHLRSSFQGRLGGSFTDAESMFGGTAELSDQSWSLRGGLDWYPSNQSAAALYVGLAYEYSEARQFFQNGTYHTEGPRNYFTGASLRTGVSAALAPRVRLRSEVLVGGYYAHTILPGFFLQQRWLATSAAATIGLEFDVLRGRAD